MAASFGADRFYRGVAKLTKANSRDSIAVRFHIRYRWISRFVEATDYPQCPCGDCRPFSCFQFAPQLEDSIFADTADL